MVRVVGNVIVVQKASQPLTLRGRRFDCWRTGDLLPPGTQLIDATWVEQLAARLEDENSLRVWLDKWVLVLAARNLVEAIADDGTQNLGMWK